MLIRHRPGIIARLARWLYEHYPRRWVFNLGYAKLEYEASEQALLTVLDVDTEADVMELRYDGEIIEDDV